MHDAQDDRSKICLNYVTKGPYVIANISRELYCCFLYIVLSYSFLTSFMFLKSKKKKEKKKTNKT